MNFITFSTATTNIFPMANSTTGGQYATEFNLRTRESVCTPQNVTYMIGPSYAHGEDDYKVTTGSSAGRSSSTLVISPGRALVNGHFVQNLAPMQIDLAAARATSPSLVGDLCIGLKAVYSTLPTMAGTIQVEDKDMMYEGIQVVVLPAAEFKLPADTPTDEDQVTAHLKLAEFTFRNGQVSGLVNNYPGKCQAFEAARIAGQEDQLAGKYLSKAGLNPRNLYVFAGKGVEGDGAGRHDTWCIAQDSLMIWDANTQLASDPHDNTEEAEFIANPLTGKVDLYMPHKQLDYEVTDTHGDRLYFQPKVISLPGANYTTGAPGTVTPEFIQHIKDKFTQLGWYKASPNGEQITYINELHDKSELPEIKPSYLPGSYVIVGHDYTVVDANDVVSPPATMYVIQDGLATKVQYVMSTYNSNSIPATCTGLELAKQEFDSDDVSHDPANGAANSMWNIENGGEYHANVGRHDYLIASTRREAGYEPPEGYYIVGSTDMIEDGLLVVDAEELNYYLVTATSAWTWTDAIWLTSQIPLATETAVGGFLNVPDNAVDNGYIFRDDTGHLRLLDYELLRTGTLAYRLSADVNLSGLTMDALQAELDDRVNERVAFPTTDQMQSRLQYRRNPGVIEITLELTDDESTPIVYLRNIDSRFGTSIYVHVTGNATSATTLVISNCQKVKIDNNIYGSPTIKLINCGLCYDSIIMDKLDTISGLTLWYEPMDTTVSAAISVDGLTVTDRSPQVTPQEIDFWSVEDPNDNHYEYALRSITFDATGQLIGASIMIRNNSTYNVDPGVSIYVSDFRLPQGSDLTYPKSRISKQLRIDGTFVSAYWSTIDSQYILTTTSFSAVSQTYTAALTDGEPDYVENLGTISLFSNTIVTSNVSGRINDTAFSIGSDIDGWTPDSFHVFDGGIVS